MIIPVSVQLKDETQPRQHYALVFPDAMGPDDLITYRNAATSVIKQILITEELQGYLADECFYLLQFAEFISDSLDNYLTKKAHEQAG